MKRKRKKERKKKGVGGKSLGLRWLYGGWVESWSVWTKERRIWKRKRKERKGLYGYPVTGVWKWRCGVVVWGRKKGKKRCSGRKKKWEKK